jgi:hypothetical protein
VLVASPFFIRESFETPVSPRRDRSETDCGPYQEAIHFNPVLLLKDFGLELLAFRGKSKMTTIRLRAAQANADDAVHGGALEAVRPYHERRISWWLNRLARTGELS